MTGGKSKNSIPAFPSSKKNDSARIIFEKRNLYGTVKVIESEISGERNRILFLDDKRQCGTEMSVAGIGDVINSFGRPGLVVARVGNACGLALAKIADNPNIARIDAIEINSVMLETMKFFEEWTGNFSRNPRIKFIIADAVDYFATTDKKYDLIDIWGRAADVPYSRRLYSSDFFSIVKSRLSPDGIFSLWIAHASSPDFVEGMKREFVKHFRFLRVYEPEEKYLLGSNQPSKNLNQITSRK